MSEDNTHIEEDSEDIIDIFHEDENILVYGFYTQIGLHKEHFGAMQIRYRALTSTWVFAGFFGIGYLMSSADKIDLPFNAFLGISALCVFVIFGVTLLWFLDIVLYQRLWLGTVVELARLEKNHDWLPTCNLNTLVMRRSDKFRFLQGTFYIGINWIFIGIALLSISQYVDGHFQVILSILAMFILFWMTAKAMKSKGGEYDNITIQSFR